MSAGNATEALSERLGELARARGYRPGVVLGVYQEPGVNFGRVTARAGAHTGYGHTSEEALRSLEEGLIEDGWLEAPDE